MKCFFHEVLSYWGYTAKVCIIDNTNLAVYSGSGDNAVFSIEMIEFAKRYGFKWKAHQIGHANRKAGKERNFYTVETNFLPGREFSSLKDLNAKAFSWSTEKWALRPISKTRLIPAKLFEYEKPYLKRLPEYIPPPYLPHKRIVDQYGYIAFNANYYWIPYEHTSKKPIAGEVDVVEYADKISIYQKNQHLIDYRLPADNIRNKKFVPDGMVGKIFEPKYIKKKSDEQEKRLRQMGEVVSKYLDYIKSSECGIKQKSKFIRSLYSFSRNIAPTVFLKSIKRAYNYRIDNLDSIERITIRLLDTDSVSLPDFSASNDFKNRISYRRGLFSKEMELDEYQKLIEDDDK
jgi:hypothetical protein